jgi:hypothetical protein
MSIRRIGSGAFMSLLHLLALLIARRYKPAEQTVTNVRRYVVQGTTPLRTSRNINVEADWDSRVY